MQRGMSRPNKLLPEPVGTDELKDAILHMIVERPLDWQTGEGALALASFEIKQVALFEPREARP